MGGKSRTIIAYNDQLARTYLRHLIERGLDPTECTEASNFTSVVDLLRNDQQTDFLIIDIELPGLAADTDLRFFATHYRVSRVAVLFTFLTRGMLDLLLDDGIAGCVPKHLSAPAMTRAFKMISDGARYIPRGMTAPDDHPAQINNIQPNLRQSKLTTRQSEVLELLGVGYSNREIAHALNIAEGTVKVHVSAAFKALGVRNRVSAAAAIQALPGDR